MEKTTLCVGGIFVPRSNGRDINDSVGQVQSRFGKLFMHGLDLWQTSRWIVNHTIINIKAQQGAVNYKIYGWWSGLLLYGLFGWWETSSFLSRKILIWSKFWILLRWGLEAGSIAERKKEIDASHIGVQHHWCAWGTVFSHGFSWEFWFYVCHMMVFPACCSPVAVFCCMVGSKGCYPTIYESEGSFGFLVLHCCYLSRLPYSGTNSICWSKMFSETLVNFGVIEPFRECQILRKNGVRVIVIYIFC